MPSRRLPPPATRSGRRAGVAALFAVAALLVANTLFADASGVLEAMRIASLLVFAGSGVAALVLSIGSLRLGERSIVVWASLVVGALAAVLIIIELTIIE